MSKSKKHKEDYDRMILPTYDQLLILVERGIIKSTLPKPLLFGFRGGAYLGSPGKDIYFLLPSLSEEQFNNLAYKVSCLFPFKPPNNHVRWAACIRYIYGCFEKQGCLRSPQDKRRMKNENLDWEIPIKFMNEVALWFEKQNNIYGLVLHYEMLAHRFGDKAIIKNDSVYLQKMLELYQLSHSLAVKCKSLKHIFTSYYWAACYFYEMRDIENSIKYHKKHLKYVEKYCPDARPGYREKVKTSFRHLKVLDRGQYTSMRKWAKKCKNKCLKKSM